MHDGYRTKTGRAWRTSQLHRMLTNPFYHGEFLFKEELFKGSHEPYYDKERYTDRLSRLGGRFVGEKKRDFEFLLSGYLKCSCGKVMTGDYKKNSPT